MERNGNFNKKSKFTLFRKQKGTKHFTASSPIVSDVLGSYTGTPVNAPSDTFPEDMYPVQDADDL